MGSSESWTDFFVCVLSMFREDSHRQVTSLPSSHLTAYTPEKPELVKRIVC